MRLSMLGYLFLFSLSITSCQGGGLGESSGIEGNVGGSEPINPSEERAYKRAILKCYKTGGSRVVKVAGNLMCY